MEVHPLSSLISVSSLFGCGERLRLAAPERDLLYSLCTFPLAFMESLNRERAIIDGRVCSPIKCLQLISLQHNADLMTAVFERPFVHSECRERHQRIDASVKDSFKRAMDIFWKVHRRRENEPLTIPSWLLRWRFYERWLRSENLCVISSMLSLNVKNIEREKGKFYVNLHIRLWVHFICDSEWFGVKVVRWQLIDRILNAISSDLFRRLMNHRKGVTRGHNVGYFSVLKVAAVQRWHWRGLERLRERKHVSWIVEKILCRIEWKIREGLTTALKSGNSRRRNEKRILAELILSTAENLMEVGIEFHREKLRSYECKKGIISQIPMSWLVVTERENKSEHRLW